MEKSLDEVENGKKSWVKTLQDFYSDFDEELTEAEEAMDGKRIKVPGRRNRSGVRALR